MGERCVGARMSSHVMTTATRPTRDSALDFILVASRCTIDAVPLVAMRVVVVCGCYGPGRVVVDVVDADPGQSVATGSGPSTLAGVAFT